MLDNNAMQNEEGGASFVYMGEGGPRVPDDVVQVRVDPSVTVIPYRAFDSKKKLEVVELHEDLLEIGKYAFRSCISLKRVIVPSTVTLIGVSAFSSCVRLEKIELQRRKVLKKLVNLHSIIANR